MKNLIFCTLALLMPYTSIFAQNSGVGTTAPASKLTVNGNATVGTGYIGTAAPANGAIIEGNVGIGTTAPSNKLHVVATTDPVRLEGLKFEGKTHTGTLVTDANGVIQAKSASTISAVRIKGAITLTVNNTTYFSDVTGAPTEVFDNQNEFSGHTFTPVQPGLYQVAYTVSFDQRTSANDGGDGFIGYVKILAGTPTGTPATAPVYETNINKIPLPETTGGSIATIVTALVKLDAGQVLQFQTVTFGATGGNTASYVINIFRVD